MDALYSFFEPSVGLAIWAGISIAAGYTAIVAGLSLIAGGVVTTPFTGGAGTIAGGAMGWALLGVGIQFIVSGGILGYASYRSYGASRPNLEGDDD